MKQTLHLSVKELITHELRTGDLASDFFSSERSIEGIFVHQRIQKSRPAAYVREVSVSHVSKVGDLTIEVRGRIDGVFYYPDHVVLEEIKTTTRDMDDADDLENPYHWAQLKIYAYMYAAEKDLGSVETCLTYVHLGSGEIKEFRRSFSLKTVRDFYQGLVNRFAIRAIKIARYHEKRDQTIHALKFPYPSYRNGQRMTIVDVYRTIAEGRQMLVQAPTGIGKTMAVLYPSLKALGEHKISRIFYLTARSTGKGVVEEAIAQLRAEGMRLKSVTLTAKEKICFNPDVSCNGEECVFARGYYDRISAATEDAFEKENLDRQTLESIADWYRVCPFELSLEMSLLADLVICDYNYVFDPQAFLRRFFLSPNEEAYLFLVDEAHNLIDRSREMFSAEIRKQEFLDLRREVKKDMPLIYKALGRINSWMLRYIEANEKMDTHFAAKDLPVDLLPLLGYFLKECEAWLSLNRKGPFREHILDLYFTVKRFLKVSEMFDATYAFCCERLKRDMKFKLFCIDPSSQLERILKKARTTVFFSGTLTPLEYFHKMFGCETSARHRILPSPFSSKNFCLMASDTISTFFKERDATKASIAAAVESLVRQKTGNYLIFFPSYDYMTLVYHAFMNRVRDVDIRIQSPGMTEREQERFLARFSRKNQKTLVGFAVMGGVFGEGIDLAGDRLTGVVIVSVGLPPPSLERILIRDYFDYRYNAGFEFAYVFPGFTRVLQAAGRVIRSETDRGTVLLIDSRYSSARYRQMFPPDWHPEYVRQTSAIGRVLKNFWISSEKIV